MLSGKCLFLQAILLLLVSQQACGLAPEPRVEDGTKNSLPNEIQQDKMFDGSKSRYEPKFNISSTPIDEEKPITQSDLNDDEDDDDDNNSKRIVITEPYKTMLQQSMRFALAQSNLVNYVQIDTIMDLMSDTSYMLASPYVLKKALRVATIIGVSLMTLIFLVPRVYLKWIYAGWVQSRGRLLGIEKYLPNGLNEMGIISLLEQKTEEMLSRFELNNRACRQQSVCQLGEMLRCAYPKSAKSVVSFISENFSRPKYRDHEYMGSFLKGFIDLNCAANIEMDQSRTCLSSYIKSMSSCVKPSPPSPQPALEPTPMQESRSLKYELFQTLKASRA